MKNLAIVFVMTVSLIYSQQIGQWKIYSDMKNAGTVVGTQDGVWAVTTGGAFKYNSTDNSFSTLTKADGLNSQALTAICMNNNKIWFGSAEGYINIYDESTGNVDRIMDIFNNTSKTQKQINSLYAMGDTIFVSTAFGLSLVNKNDFSFFETFMKIGDFPSDLNVKNVIRTTTIHVLTDSGVAVQKPGALNLSVPSSWTTYKFNQQIPAQYGNKILLFNGQLILATDDGIYRFINNQWQQFLMPNTDIKDIFIFNNNIYFITEQALYLYSNSQLSQLYENTSLVFNSLFVADAQTIFISSATGLIKYNSGNVTNLYPDGPLANQFINMAFDDSGNLWVATGKDNHGVGIIKYDGSQWQYFNKVTNTELLSNDFINVASSGNTVLFSNWGKGLTIFHDNIFSTYDNTNTDLIGNSSTFIAIAAAQADSKGNIWILNSASAGNKQLSVLTTDNKWYHYSISGLSGSDALGKLIIDQYDTKWFTVEIGNAGLFYFNENGTFANLNDDEQGYINQNNNNVILSSNISSLALDKRGQLWIGTSDGINVIQDPARPISTISRTTGFSVRNQSITCVAVDPLDQKWLGTKQGVFVLSSDGIQLLNNYTSLNSPLPDNDIRSIVVDPATGMVYIGTDKGLVALSTSSIKPVDSFSDLFIYPNPYIIDGADTHITIDGLIENTSVKIIDVSGKLVRTFVTPGGRVAFWDGKNNDGNYVSTGVYIIVAYDEDANSVATAKVAVIKK